MNQFKFRAWDTKNKIMVYYEPLELGFLPGISKLPFPTLLANPNLDKKITKFDRRKTPRSVGCPNFILMQYINIDDKHGKEVYEGDFIKPSIGDPEVVVFSDGSYCTKHPLNIGEYCMILSQKDMFTSGYEIIANIHENPGWFRPQEKK